MKRLGKWLACLLVGLLASCVVTIEVPGVRAAQPREIGTLVVQADALHRAFELNERALKLMNSDRYRESEPLYKESLEILRSHLGNNHPEVAVRLSNLAELYRYQGRYTESESLNKQSLEIRQSQLGNNHPEVATSLNNLALLYQAQGRYAESEPLFEQSIEILRSHSGNNHPNISTGLNNLADLYYDQGRYAEAEPLYVQALAILRSQLGNNHLNVANRLNSLARLYRAQMRYEEAEPLYDQALEIRKLQLGDDHLGVALSLSNLAKLYQDQGRYEEAEPLYDQALEIRKLQLGDDHLDVAISLNDLAMLYQAQGRYKDSEQLLKQSLEIRQSQLELDHPDLALSLNNLAMLYQAQGRHEESEPLYKQSLEIHKSQFGETHPSTANNLNNLASLYRIQGRYVEAELLYEQSLEILQSQPSIDYLTVAINLNNLAGLYRIQGRYQEAESLFNQSIDILKSRLGPMHPNLATGLSNLARLYQAQGRYDDAEALYKQALEMRILQLGENHPDVANSLNNLAVLYEGQGRYDDAEALYKQALEMRILQLGENHPDVAESLNNLAGLHFARGRYGEAELLYDQSLEIKRAQLGANHPDVAASLNNLAALYKAQGNFPKALAFLRDGLDIEEQHLDLNLATLAPEPRRAYAATVAGTTHSAISLHLQTAPDSPEAAQLALTTLLRRKGRILEAGTNTLQTLRQNLEPEDQQTFEQLTDLYRQLSNLRFNRPETLALADYREAIAQLETEANDLETTLARRSAVFRSETEPTEIRAVQAKIPDDGVLLEYVRYRSVDSTATRTERFGPGRYGAYLLFKGGRIEAVDLGDAIAIETAARDLGAALGDRRSAPVDIQRAATVLSDLVLAPLQASLDGIDHLLISSDGDLNLIPFEVLPASNGRYLVQDFKISYLNSGRELLRLGLVPASENPAVILTAPNYGTDVRLASADGTRSVDLENLTVATLPGAEREGEALAVLLPEAILRSGSEATETFLKQVQSPQMLHIATHGLFLPPTPIWQRFNPETGTLDEIPGENPLLRAMLALEGFNHRSSGEEDGVFTALEASQLNLFGTQLVVLSACDTGRGDVANGEGVYGLRRAFSLAGAESLVMSLWRVEDQGTQELMTRYYQLLLDGLGRSDALRQIQLDMIAAGEPPYRWAAFVLAGNWLPLGEHPILTRQQFLLLGAIALGTLSLGLVLITLRSLKPKRKRSN